MPEIKTLSPDSGLSPDVSVGDLGKMLGGEDIAPVTEPAPPAEPAAPPATEAAAAEPPAVEPVSAIQGEAPPATQQEPKPEEKKESWVDRRLSQLAEKRREADARATSAESRLRDAERELAAIKAQPGPAATPAAPAPAAPAGKTKPVLKDFVAALAEGEEYDQAVERYTDAVGDWRDEQKAVQQRQQTQADSQKAQQDVFAKDWQEAMKVHPDFEDVVDRVRSVAPEGLQVAVSQLRQDDGTALWPLVTVYLDEHPEELAALSTQFQQNPYAATAKLGRLAGTLTPGAPPAPIPAAPAAPRVAPKPPATVGGSAAPSIVDLHEADMNVFAREMTLAGL